MCLQCGSPFNGCRYGLLGGQGMLQGIGQGNIEMYNDLRNALTPTPTMSIEDAEYILMEVGCNNLLGVYKTSEDAQEAANKICKKNIKKLHIFKLVVTVESENKVSVTSKS